MDPIPLGRVVVLAAGGFALGYIATVLVDALSANPLLASVAIAAGAVAVGVWLRRGEFLNLVVESALYAYCGYLGLAVIRSTSVQHHLAQHVDIGGSIDLTPLILLAGFGFTAVIVFLIAMPAWMLAGRVSEPKAANADSFWSFVESRTVADAISTNENADRNGGPQSPCRG